MEFTQTADWLRFAMCKTLCSAAAVAKSVVAELLRRAWEQLGKRAHRAHATMIVQTFVR